jgi:tetratricopeptide (TPR) repeat protein
MKVSTPKEFSQAGTKAYTSGDYLAAAQNFEAASKGYAAQGDELNAAEMANNLSVALLQAGEAQASLDATLGTPAIFEAANDALRQAMALGNAGAALDALDQIEEAEEAYKHSLELFDEVGEQDLRANVLQSLSKLQLRSGRQLEALATMQAGMENIERPNLRQRMLKKLLKTPFKFLNR